MAGVGEAGTEAARPPRQAISAADAAEAVHLATLVQRADVQGVADATQDTAFHARLVLPLLLTALDRCPTALPSLVGSVPLATWASGKYPGGSQSFWGKAFHALSQASVEGILLLMRHLPPGAFPEEDFGDSLCWALRSALEADRPVNFLPIMECLSETLWRWNVNTAFGHRMLDLVDVCTQRGRVDEGLEAARQAMLRRPHVSMAPALISVPKANAAGMVLEPMCNCPAVHGSLLCLGLLGSSCVSLLGEEHASGYAFKWLSTALGMEVGVEPLSMHVSDALLRGGLHHWHPLQRLVREWLAAGLELPPAGPRLTLFRRAHHQANWDRRRGAALLQRAAKRRPDCFVPPEWGASPPSAEAFAALLLENPLPPALLDPRCLRACLAQPFFQRDVTLQLLPAPGAQLATVLQALLKPALHGGFADVAAFLMELATTISHTVRRKLAKPLRHMLEAALRRGQWGVLSAMASQRGAWHLRWLFDGEGQWTALGRAAGAKPARRWATAFPQSWEQPVARFQALQAMCLGHFGRQNRKLSRYAHLAAGAAVASAAATGNAAALTAMACAPSGAASRWITVPCTPGTPEPAVPPLVWAARGGHATTVRVLLAAEAQQAAASATAARTAAETALQALINATLARPAASLAARREVLRCLLRCETLQTDHLATPSRTLWRALVGGLTGNAPYVLPALRVLFEELAMADKEGGDLARRAATLRPSMEDVSDSFGGGDVAGDGNLQRSADGLRSTCMSAWLATRPPPFPAFPCALIGNVLRTVQQSGVLSMLSLGFLLGPLKSLDFLSADAWVQGLMAHMGGAGDMVPLGDGSFSLLRGVANWAAAGDGMHLSPHTAGGAEECCRVVWGAWAFDKDPDLYCQGQAALLALVRCAGRLPTSHPLVAFLRDRVLCDTPSMRLPGGRQRLRGATWRLRRKVVLLRAAMGRQE